MTNRKQLLQELWEESNEDNKSSKPEFLAECIFNFTTYDSEVSELFAKNMVDVLLAIASGKAFEYHSQSEAHYYNYLIMVNMPFLVEKIEWGTSIRGAWFYLDEPVEIYRGITVSPEDVATTEKVIIIDKGFDDMILFVNELAEWLRE